MKKLEVEKNGDRIVFTHAGPPGSISEVNGCLVENIPSPYKEITHPEAVVFARWQLIIKELEFAEVQLKELINRGKELPLYLDRRDINGVIVKSLFDSAIVSYAKCFNQAKGRKVKLEYRDVFKSPEGKVHGCQHTLVKNLRDSYIAHAGESIYEQAKTFAVIDPIGDIRFSKNSVYAYTSFTLPDADYIDKTLKLVQFVHDHVAKDRGKKLDDFTNKVIQNPHKYNVDDIFQ